MARYDLSAVSLGTLLDDPDVAAIVEKHAPGISKDPIVASVKSMPAQQVLGLAAGVIGQARIDAILAEVEAL
ncbi:MAG TPA: hypothetical protein PKM36_06955 [Propionibacteriaceae bacterium]|nr:hypothetical protein [Propionibacteriaceae bacterium]HPZ48232.1 hypothetical protein [Propionibacteriaceae bacterium]HQE30608.1 hypothetical protein [Propionibacteriaceae bacterium]